MVGERFAVDFYDKREAPSLEEGQTLYLDKAERPDVDENMNVITRNTLGVYDSYGMLVGYVPDRLVNRLRNAEGVQLEVYRLPDGEVTLAPEVWATDEEYRDAEAEKERRSEKHSRIVKLVFVAIVILLLVVVLESI
jgi:hypothetical protein